MSARWTRGKIDRFYLDLRMEAERKAKIVRARDASQAKVLVKVWNSRQSRGAVPLFWPPIGAAVLAGYPFLSFICPGCEREAGHELSRPDADRFWVADQRAEPSCVRYSVGLIGLFMSGPTLQR